MMTKDTVAEYISGNVFDVAFVRTVPLAIGLSTDHPQNARGPEFRKRFLRQQTDAVDQGVQKFFFLNV